MKKYKAIAVITYCLLTLCSFSADYFYDILPEVSLTKAHVGRVIDTVSYSGVVQAKAYGVFSSHAAKVTDVYIREGQYVQEGQLLARLDLNDTTVDAIGHNIPDLFPYAGSLDEDMLNEIWNTATQQSSYEPIIQSGAGIRATSSGYVSSISVEEGDYAGRITPLFIITDTAQMSVCIQVAEDRISEIAVGQNATLSGSGFSGHTYQGTVTHIAQRANQSLFGNSGSQIAVDISFQNPDSFIMPGFTVTANIQLGIRNGVTQIPLDMIEQDDTGKEFVWIYQDGHVHKEYIRCQYTAYGYAEVSNFDLQQYIVSQTSAPIRDGDTVVLADGWKTW